MKFFQKNVIRLEHIEALKRTLKKYVTNKVIDYNGNFEDHIEFQKGMLVVDKDNELLKLIKEHLEPWADPWQVLQKQIKAGSWVEYNYDKLPYKLKSYMYTVDAMLYENWYRDTIRIRQSEEYDRKEEKLRQAIPDYTEDEYERYVLLGHPIPSPIAIKARASARRSYKSVNEWIKCNIDRFTQFVTLTVASEEGKQRHMQHNEKRLEDEVNINFDYIDGNDFAMVKKMFTKTMDTLKKRLKRKGISFEYIAVWELQGNGNYHFHMLCTDIPEDEQYTVPEWLDYNHIEKKRNNANGLIEWTYGKSDVQAIKSKERLTTYVSKYIIKSFQNVSEERFLEYLNQKKYFVTQGLEKPHIEYIDSFPETELEPYVKVYVNPYNLGLITKKSYTKVVVNK